MINKYTKTSFISFLLAFLALNILNAQKSRPETFMWELVSEHTKVYLLGSIHIANEELYPINPKIEEAFNNSDALAVEMNIKNVDYSELINLMMLPDDQTLKDVINIETYNKVKDIFEKHFIPEMLFNKLKPSYVVMLLSQLEFVGAGFEPQFGLDLYFINKAEKREIEILELESLELQLSVFEIMDANADIYFDFSIQQIDSTMERFEQIMSAWKTGDTEKLTEVINESYDDPKYEIFMDALLDKRNYDMADKIEEYLQGDKVIFVVVGAAHLIGETGLIKLLEEKYKYNIRQI